MNAPVRRSEGAGPIDAPTVRSYLSATDLATLAATGARPASSPLPPAQPGAVLERPHRLRPRPGLPRFTPTARRGDPQWPPRQHPHRHHHADVLRFRHPRAAAHPTQPTDLGPSPHTARRPLVEQTRRCGKPGCRCAEGNPHGPYVYFGAKTVGRSHIDARSHR
ncbi:MAG: DUF6788 family protein [Pseudonocardiaceae bacterium]